MKKTDPTPESPKLTIALPALVEEAAPVDIDDDLAAALAPRTAKSKPDISGLPDAVVGGQPVFKAGDKIVIERYNSLLEGRPYLDTRSYTVNSVDLETGKVRLWDESLIQHASDNWKTGLATGQVYKFAMGSSVSTKRKRGRPRKNPIEAPKTTAPGEKKKRGRPAGTKNRSKDVIAAEKAAARADKAARAAKRGAKR